MATLEKIRSKSVLLVSIIFVALFLFIITIIDNPTSLFVDHDTVLDVTGRKIGREQFQQRANELREQAPQTEDINQQTIASLITESLFDQEAERLGLTVTPEEISRVMVGENAPYAITQSFVQRFGMEPRAVLEAIQDPQTAGLNEEQVRYLTSAYTSFENDVEQYLLSQKFYNMLDGLIAANKLDTKSLYERGKTNYDLASVSRSIYTVPDTISRDDVEKYYRTHRADNKIGEEMRYVRFVNLPIEPSPADRQKAVATVNQAIAELSQGQGMDAIAGNAAFVVETFTADTTALKAIKTPGLADFVKTAAPGEIRLISNNAYSPSDPSLTLARLIDRENKVNSAKVKQVVIDPAANGDSILALLNSGTAPDSITGAQALPVQTMKLDQLTNVIDTLRAAGTGVYVPVTAGQSTLAIAVDSYSAPEDVYTYATASYAIEPSRETIEQLNSRMREFLINATTLETFNDDNAIAQGLGIEDALVSPSAASVGYLKESRDMVGWAMDAKKGQVSPLFTDGRNSRLSAVAVADIYNDYVGLTFPPVYTNISGLARMDQNAGKLIEQYTAKGTTLDDYRQAMEATRIDTIHDVTLSAPRYSQLGAIAAHKPGDLVGPIRWNGSVIVCQILDAKESPMPFDEKATAMQFSRTARQAILGNDPTPLLLGNGKIKNRYLKLFRE